MRSTRYSGFTLVELLVVIAIIGVLISLLLPALQIAREAARKTSCENNLKQLTLGVTTYESFYKVFPPSGFVSHPAANNPRTAHTTKNAYVEFEPKTGGQFSWLVIILPQIEQANLYKQFDFSKTVMEQERKPQRTFLPSFTCPSDNSQGRFYSDTLNTRREEFAKGNYAAYCSPFHVELQNFAPGALVGHHAQARKRFKDGESNTIMLSEVRTRDHVNDQRGAWALPWTGASLLAYDAHDLNQYTEYQNPGRYRVDPAYVKESTQPPNNEGPNFDMLYSCPDTAAAVYENMPCRRYGLGADRYLSAAARSAHPGGVWVSYCDGRVVFLNQNVDRTAMAYLISINDGQPVQIPD